MRLRKRRNSKLSCKFLRTRALIHELINLGNGSSIIINQEMVSWKGWPSVQRIDWKVIISSDASGQDKKKKEGQREGEGMGRSWSLLSIIKPGIYKCWPVLQLPFCSGDDETWFISRDLETNEPLWRTIVPLRTGGGPNRREESNRPWLARRSDRFSRWFSAVLRQSRRLLIPIVRKQQRCFA